MHDMLRFEVKKGGDTLQKIVHTWKTCGYILSMVLIWFWSK
jgi:hypothetical protein